MNERQFLLSCRSGRPRENINSVEQDLLLIGKFFPFSSLCLMPFNLRNFLSEQQILELVNKVERNKIYLSDEWPCIRKIFFPSITFFLRLCVFLSENKKSTLVFRIAYEMSNWPQALYNWRKAFAQPPFKTWKDIKDSWLRKRDSFA